ncbi:hypothetical protein [Micromonospora sp. NPDC047134]|uniref:hypothetical protein n=1 Tax=Micromonospora sp. NPDC047134 TaxID=3154340 RepID=UPI003400D791
MPEPQPGTDRPVDGTRPQAQRDGEPAVTQEQPTPVVPGTPTGPDGTRMLPADTPDPTSPPAQGDQSASGDQPTRPNASAPSDPTAAPPAAPDATAPADTADAEVTAPADTTPERSGTAPEQPGSGPRADGPATDHPPTMIDPERSATPPAVAEVGPQGTRVMQQPLPEAEPPPPRWSAAAAVPPAPPRRRAWGESAEPTPPPPSVAATHQPEHQTPVDPWAGADTSGWDLPSADFPALPPTLSYPAPPPTRAHPAPPDPPPPPAHQPPSPAHQPPSVAHQPPPAVFPPPAAPARPMTPGYPPPNYPRQVHPAPPSAPVGPPPPPARGRKVKKAPPPGWQPPAGAAPKRKRRRWPWVLLLTLACCCGCPAYYGTPMVTQYPANAALPKQVADLRLREDPRNAQAARKLENQTRQAHLLADDVFAGVYTTSVGKRVTVFGGTGFRLTPSADADAEIERLTEEYSLGEAEVVDSGVRGRHGRCAAGHSEGSGVVVCTSVDHGSITTAVFTNLSMDDSARLLGTLREQIITPE